jgi:hypothetical protein
MAFEVYRRDNEVFVTGSIEVHFDWAPNSETISPNQAGVTNCLAEHGFDAFTGVCQRPDGTKVGWDYHATLGVFDGSKVLCTSADAADIAETVLRKRIDPNGG